jgi:hypothetical protein
MRVIYVLAFVLTISSLRSFASNIDEMAKEFIQYLLENQSNDDGLSYTDPIRAIPRGTRIRNRLGLSPSAFLVQDIILWDPLLVFPELSLSCPSCVEHGLRESLRPIRWKDGCVSHDQLRRLYGLCNDVLLVGRIYICKNKHQILSHDQVSYHK